MHVVSWEGSQQLAKVAERHPEEAGKDLVWQNTWLRYKWSTFHINVSMLFRSSASPASLTVFEVPLDGTCRYGRMHFACLALGSMRLSSMFRF